MKVINLFAGPGVGKSTTGMLLSGMLSMRGFRCEYVPEFAKFATFAKYNAALGDQDYMFAKQHNRLSVLRGDSRLQYAVMDGPLPIALNFSDPADREYEELVMKRFNSFDNLNIFLVRNTALAYQAVGRNENLDEAQALCDRTLALMQRVGIPYESMKVDSSIACRLYERVVGESAPMRPA